MNVSAKIAIIIMLVVLALTLLSTCGGDDKDEQLTQAPTASTTPTIKEDVTITIGLHVDLSGIGASGNDGVIKAFEDLVKYYNDENLIPGVKLKIVKYDNQWNPDRDVAGYEYLKAAGADTIFAISSFTPLTLKSLLQEDDMVLFALYPLKDALDPPGYIFSAGTTLPEYSCWSLLKWIAENDPDFPKDRPATLGAAGWTDGHSEPFFEAAEEYAQVHPNQYDWIDGFITDYSFSWKDEINVLKNCDYVIPPAMLTTFASDFRAAGGRARFIGDHYQLAFLDLIDKMNIWNEIDGMYIITSTRWWNEEGPIINLAKELLARYHSEEEADSIMKTNAAYRAIAAAIMLVECIETTVNAVGPENFDSQALYEEMQSFTSTKDDLDFYSFTENKRDASNYTAVYEVDGDKKDFFRLEPEWQPLVREP